MPANAPAARSTSARDIAAASVGDGRVVVRALHKILRRDLLGEVRRAERRPSERAYLVERGCGQRDAADLARRRVVVINRGGAVSRCTRCRSLRRPGSSVVLAGGRYYEHRPGGVLNEAVGDASHQRGFQTRHAAAPDDDEASIARVGHR
jgi:hypothetical protein